LGSPFDGGKETVDLREEMFAIEASDYHFFTVETAVAGRHGSQGTLRHKPSGHDRAELAQKRSCPSQRIFDVVSG
jgi:hypothetical protein